VIDAHGDSARRMCAAARVRAMAMRMSRGATGHQRRCITALTLNRGARGLDTCQCGRMCGADAIRWVRRTRRTRLWV
jgi:hypothetical protein